MKKQTLNSVLLFLILNAAFLISANAQIVYTDVNPDVTITGTYLLDINNDGINDYSITKTSTNSFCTKSDWGSINNYLNINAYNGNIIADTNAMPAAIAFGKDISSGSYSWNNTSHLLKSYGTSTHYSGCTFCCSPVGAVTYSGNWSVTSDKYLGLKFTVGANTYYCWARLNVYSNASACIIKDYAYNSLPNQPILAGETSCTNPTVTLNASGPLSFCAGDSVTLTANGTGYLYQWKRNGVNILGATAQTYTAKTAGKYKCRVTNSCGSKASKTDTVKVPCRNADASFLNITRDELEHLSIYPNPATNSVNIKFPSDDEGQIQIINLFGQIVLSEKIFSDETKIDVTKFSKGMYAVRWSSGENYETKTFSIVK